VGPGRQGEQRAAAQIAATSVGMRWSIRDTA